MSRRKQAVVEGAAPPWRLEVPCCALGRQLVDGKPPLGADMQGQPEALNRPGTNAGERKCGRGRRHVALEVRRGSRMFNQKAIVSLGKTCVDLLFHCEAGAVIIECFQVSGFDDVDGRRGLLYDRTSRLLQ